MPDRSTSLRMTDHAFAARKSDGRNRKRRPATKFPRPTNGISPTSSPTPTNGVKTLPGSRRLSAPNELERPRRRIGRDAARVLEFEKALDLNIERLYHFASLQLAEDSANPEYLARDGQLQNLLTTIGESTAFVEPEILAIDDATFDAFLDDPALAEWRISLRKLRRIKPHTLSETEERLLALGSAALDGYDDTFSQLTNVDMKFGVLVDEKGVERPLSQSSFSSFLVKRDPELRKRAFHQFYAEFQDHKFTLASTLANSVKADVFRARARNYPSALRGRALPRRRAGRGLRQPHRHPSGKISRRSSATTICASACSASTKFTLRHLCADRRGHRDRRHLGRGDRQGARRARAARRRICRRARRRPARPLVRPLRNKGKRSGAFSSGSYGKPPYILMNYKRDVFSDVYTLAHEAGHSMHTWFAQRTQPFQTTITRSSSPRSRAPSTKSCSPIICSSTTDDPKMRAYLINRQIDDIRGTVFRQTMFAEFEKDHPRAWRKRANRSRSMPSKANIASCSRPTSATRSCSIRELDLECLRIPHFYSAFYVYKYATGLSAAIALAEQVLAGAPGAVEAYLGFLKSGGSKFPLETLQTAGVDMSTPGAGRCHARALRPARGRARDAALNSRPTISQPRKAGSGALSGAGPAFTVRMRLRVAIPRRLRLRRTRDGPRIDRRAERHPEAQIKTGRKCCSCACII